MLFVIDYRNRGFVCLNVIGLHHKVADPEVQRSEKVGDIKEPVVDRGWWDVHSLTLHHLYLSVERKAVHIFADHEVCQN